MRISDVSSDVCSSDLKVADLLEFSGKIVDPTAFLIVLAGALLIALLQVGRADFARLPSAFRPLLRARPRHDRDAARHAMRQVERVAQLTGLACADRVETTGRFLRQANDDLAHERHVPLLEMRREDHHSEPQSLMRIPHAALSL